MYNIASIEIKEKDIIEYSKELAILSNNLYNRTLYIYRQLFTGLSKEIPTTNEKEVIDLINKYIKLYNKKLKSKYKKEHGSIKGFTGVKIDKDHKFINYNFLDYIYKNENDIDYRSLPIHTAQNVIKQVIHDIESFFNAIKEYKINPNKFLGKPKLPKYHTKGGYNVVYISNISSSISNDLLKLPKITKGKECKYIKLKENIFKDKGSFYNLKIKINNNKVIYRLTFDNKQKEKDKLPNNNRYAGIDLGVDNIITLTNNIGLRPILIKGNDIKSFNQYINKEIANYTSIAKKVNNLFTTKRIQSIWNKRFKYFYNFFHRTNNLIIEYLKTFNINTIVIGKNNSWKQELKLHKKDKQNFVYIPYDMFISDLKYKCDKEGINCIIREESYTSKASLFDFDNIPVYNKSDKTEYKFSGKRIKRGLYQTNKVLINADVNGSCNIIRKEFSDAFNNIDLKYLLNPIKVNQMTLVYGIVGV